MRYSPTLVDHFLNPRNAGIMREPDGVGEDEYAGCRDLALDGLPRDRRHAADVAAGALRAAAAQYQARQA